MIFEPNCSDDFASDSAYYGEIRYVSLADATDRYNLNKDEVDKIKASVKNTTGGFFASGANQGSNNVNSGTHLRYVNQDEGGLKVMVFEAEWQDTKSMRRKKVTDKYGNVHYKRTKSKKGKGVINKKIKIWRKATLVAGTVLKDWGIRENMVRSVDDLSETKSSYRAILPDYINRKTVSMVEQLKDLQRLKNIVVYQLELAMMRSGGKGFFYDVSTLPDKWEVEDVLKYVKTSSVAFIDTFKDGQFNPSTPLKEFDMTLSQSIGQYINIIAFLDKEMDSISGVNKAREGQSAGNREAVRDF
jgi:hypothetical protein